MAKRGSAKTSAPSRRAPRPKSTSARSSSSSGSDALRAQLAKALEWAEAHVDFERAVEGVPAEARGRKPAGLPYSLWQLLEHLRLSQRDVLEFCRNSKYVEMKWPDDYWPKSDAPPDAAAWERSIAEFRRDRSALRTLATDPDLDLFATIPHGSGQTYIREVLLMIDHNAYHIGEIVAARRIMGLWR
jgi:uncharacterized damage-inducible protein DinB